MDDFAGSRTGRSTVGNETVVEALPPEEAVAATERGGKPAITEGVRPMTVGTKRARIVEAASKGMKIPQIMTEFSITRSCALSHLNDAQKFNGVGYKLHNDGSVTITMENKDNDSENRRRRDSNSGEAEQKATPSQQKPKVSPLSYFRRKRRVDSKV